MPAVWPKQQRLIRDLREVLRRSFGCHDAWVVAGAGRCRLEVRLGGRRLVLLDDPEDRFWARFYTEVERSRLHMGEQVTERILWRKSPDELVDALSAPWMERVGPLPHRRGAHLGAPSPPGA